MRIVLKDKREIGPTTIWGATYIITLLPLFLLGVIETIAHSRWIYDDAGRLVESNSWMKEERIDRVVYVYDETGRHIRTTHVNHDGTGGDREVCSYDAAGRKTKVRFLPPREADSECTTGNGCGASTGYAIEGTDSAYGAPGAATVTITYDARNLPAKVSFHDANHQSLRYVIFMRDSAGRLLSEESHQGERSPLQSYLDIGLFTLLNHAQ